MPENPSQQHDNPESVVASIQQRLSEEGERETSRNDSFTLGESAKLKKLKGNEKIKDRQNGEVAKLTVDSESRKNGQQKEKEKSTENILADHDGSQAPRAPGYTDTQKEEVSGSSDSQETHKDESTENKEEKEQMSLDKVMSGGDPVLPYDEENFDDSRGGAWFLPEDANPDDSNNLDSKVEIIYKLPNNEVAERKMVSWLELIPTYDGDKEYTEALRTIREKYEQVKEQGNNEVYEKHLLKLGVQTAYAALLFNEKEKEKIREAKAARNAV